jgi:single-strand DNA-binding protein
MKNFAEFQILGNIGSTKEVGTTVRVQVCASYAEKQEDGSYINRPAWNTVTIFGDRRKYALGAAKGDLVMVRGRIRQGCYERNGKKVYSVDLIGDEFSILTPKGE